MGRTTKRAIIAAAAGGLTLAVLVPAQAARSIPAVTGGGWTQAGSHINVNAVQHGDGTVSGKIQVDGVKAGVACVAVNGRVAVVAGQVAGTDDWLAVKIEDLGKPDRAAFTGDVGQLAALFCELGEILAQPSPVSRGNFKVRPLPAEPNALGL